MADETWCGYQVTSGLFLLGIRTSGGMSNGVSGFERGKELLPQMPLLRRMVFHVEESQ